MTLDPFGSMSRVIPRLAQPWLEQMYIVIQECEKQNPKASLNNEHVESARSLNPPSLSACDRRLEEEDVGKMESFYFVFRVPFPLFWGIPLSLASATHSIFFCAFTFLPKTFLLFT